MDVLLTALSSGSRISLPFCCCQRMRLRILKESCLPRLMLRVVQIQIGPQDPQQARRRPPDRPSPASARRPNHRYHRPVPNQPPQHLLDRHRYRRNPDWERPPRSPVWVRLALALRDPLDSQGPQPVDCHDRQPQCPQNRRLSCRPGPHSRPLRSLRFRQCRPRQLERRRVSLHRPICRPGPVARRPQNRLRQLSSPPPSPHLRSRRLESDLRSRPLESELRNLRGQRSQRRASPPRFRASRHPAVNPRFSTARRWGSAH